MILRKPYAFLIKHFKIIHIFLFGLFGYLLFKLRDIYVFFQNYVKNDVYTYVDNIANEYIGIMMFIISLFILLSGIAIFYLMREKEKPVLFYRIMIGYAVSLFVVLFIYRDFYVSLEYAIPERTVISIYRDIIGFFYYGIYFFIAFTFVRGFGFDIKRFSFEKDLKELNVNETDSEEFELSIDIDKEKIMNNIRKEKRLIGYYIKENAKILSIILIIALVILGIYIYNTVIVTNITYSQNTVVTANNIEYSVKKSYFTDKNKSNQDLGINYVIVDLSILNKNMNDVQLNLLKIRLKVGNQYFYPITNQYSYFDDLGIGYKNNVLKSNTIHNYILVFRLNKNITNSKNIILQLYDKEENDNNEIKTIYQQIKLTPLSDNDTLKETVQLNDELILTDTALGKGNLKIVNYDISSKYIYEYEECLNDNCQKYDKVIQSNSNNQVLRINYDISDINQDVFENYASIIYEINGSSKTINENSINVLYNDDKFIFLETDKNLDKSSKIILEFNIRGSIYQIVLKDNTQSN